MQAAQAIDPQTVENARIAIVLMMVAIVVFRRQLLVALARVLIIVFIIAAITGVVTLVELAHL